MSSSIEFEGLDNLMIKLENIGDSRKINQTINKALKEGAEILKEQVEEEAPIDTGNLHDNIEITKIKTSTKDGKSISVKLGDDAWYGKFPELGAGNIEENPFMSRAYEQKKNEILNAIKLEIGKVIE